MSEEFAHRRRVLHRQLHKKSPFNPSLNPRFSPTAVFTDPAAALSSTASQQAATTDPVTTSASVSVQASTSDTPAQVTQTILSTTSPSPALSLTSTSAAAVVTTPTASATSSVAAVTSSTPASTQPVVVAQTSSSSRVAAATTAKPASALGQSTEFIIQTISGSAVTISSAAPTASSTAVASSTTSSGIIIGGVAAAIVGAIGVLAAVVYFLRKCRNNEESSEAWNAEDVRRHSTMLNDDMPPPMSRAMTFNRGAGGANSPRPPTMIERKMTNASPAMLHRQPTFGNYSNYGPEGMRGPPENMYGGYGPGPTEHASFQSFAPGDVISPITAHSTNPFITPYDSPMGSPVTSVPAHYGPGSPYNDLTPPQSALTRQPSSAYVTRQNSMGGGPFSPMSSTTPGPSAWETEDPHYVDLSRSSVTPFQAAQYAEISRKLGAPTPPPLNLGAINEEKDLPTPGTAVTTDFDTPPSAASIDAANMAVHQAGFAHYLSAPVPAETANPESPFADPGMYAAGQATPRSANNTMNIPSYVSDADMEADAQELEFPAPPAAVHHHSRIDSNPPILPEILVQNRAFSPVSVDFSLPVSAHGSPSPFRTEFGDVRTPPPVAVLNRASPLATSASVQAESAEAPRREPKAEGQAQGHAQKRPDTVYTIYDEEDAYGGI